MLIVEKKKNDIVSIFIHECVLSSVAGSRLSLVFLLFLLSLSLSRGNLLIYLSFSLTRERNSWRSIRFRSKLSPNNSKYNKYIAAMNLDCIFTLHFPITFLFKLSNPVLSSAVNNLSLSTRTRSRIYLEIKMK